MSLLPTDWKDKALFTPGPLTTSRTVKQAMLRDLGSRDADFIHIVREVRGLLLKIGQVDPETYTSVLVQGSGTFGIEAVISSVVPPQGRLLVLVNGAYGERMVKMAHIHQIPVAILASPENLAPDLEELERTLAETPTITHVAAVHCETTTGILNPIDEIGKIVRQHHCTYIVDAMSSFGAYDIPVEAYGIDFLISSSNKCIEGVPGFSVVLARKEALQSAQGKARSLALDLYSQWEGLEKDGQFRFTPPVHTILAFYQALLELEDEGGPTARGKLYQENYMITVAGMESLGFRPYLKPDQRGYTITSFYYPKHAKFLFKVFYEKLSEKGCVIYPGKLSHADCFRIGHIGRLGKADVFLLLAAVRETLAEMGIDLSQP